MVENKIDPNVVLHNAPGSESTPLPDFSFSFLAFVCVSYL